MSPIVSVTGGGVWWWCAAAFRSGRPGSGPRISPGWALGWMTPVHHLRSIEDNHGLLVVVFRLWTVESVDTGRRGAVWQVEVGGAAAPARGGRLGGVVGVGVGVAVLVANHGSTGGVGGYHLARRAVNAGAVGNGSRASWLGRRVLVLHEGLGLVDNVGAVVQAARTSRPNDDRLLVRPRIVGPISVICN